MNIEAFHGNTWKNTMNISEKNWILGVWSPKFIISHGGISHGAAVIQTDIPTHNSIKRMTIEQLQRGVNLQ
jgi:hypothetical protein